MPCVNRVNRELSFDQVQFWSDHRLRKRMVRNCGSASTGLTWEAK
uniref:Uncharacterized protein n=1 Tax=Burkholderia sp. (strain CCGE1003) TaxID=640512 RepID=E1TEM6_BURSG